LSLLLRRVAPSFSNLAGKTMARQGMLGQK